MIAKRFAKIISSSSDVIILSVILQEPSLVLGATLKTRFVSSAKKDSCRMTN